MKKLFNKKIIAELLIIFLLSLVPLLWFKPGTILVGHDNTYPLAPKPFLANRLTTWTENFFGHDQSLILGTIPIHLIDAIPSFFGASLQTGQKMVYVFWFFLIGVSAYILAWVLRPRSSLFHLTAVMLYQFNYFILQGWWIGEKSKFSAYIALPLVLSVFFLVTRKSMRVFTGAILTSLILFVFNGGGLYGVPLYGGAFVAVGILIIFKFFDYLFSKKYNDARRLVIFIVLSIMTTLLVNAYFFIPAYAKLRSGSAPDVNSVGGVSGIISWADEISANASFLNLFRLEGIPEWYDNPEHPFSKTILQNPAFIAVSFLWPLLIVTSLLVAKKTKNDRIVMYFFVVYLVGIFFTAGTHPPLGFLYQFFMQHIPRLVIFRSPYFKFAPAIFLSTTYLIAYVIDSIPYRIRKLAFVIIIAIVFTYHYPYFTGNFFAWRDQFSTRLTIPSYVYEFGSWLNNEKTDDGRVLFLPPNNADLRYSTYTWGYLSFQALPTLLSGKSVIINNDQVNYEEQTMLKSLYAAIEQKNEETIKKLASILHISYVVLQKDATSDPRVNSPIDVKVYAQVVRNNTQFVFVRSFGEWDIFTLREMMPPSIYMTDQLVSFQGSVEELDPYYNFIAKETPFVWYSDAKRLSADGFASEIITPSCLTCLKNRPRILFPERSILPDNPFYQIVLLLENRQPIPKVPKAAIYHLLGRTLKRVREISEMLQKKALTQEMVDQYAHVLESMQQYFQKLPTPQEKIELARDIRDFLLAERNFLFQNNPARIPFGTQMILMGRIFKEMSRLEKQFELPEFALDETHNAVYEFSLLREDELEIAVHTAELPIVNEGDQLSVTIDNNFHRELRLTNEMLGRPWLSFGQLRLPAGFHTLMFSFPQPQRNSQKLNLTETEFSVPGGNTCFGTLETNLNRSKLYKLTVSYLNNFYNNLILFTWDQSGSTRDLKSAVGLTTGVNDKNEQIIEVSGGTKEVLVALCAPNLTQELIDKQFQVTFSEIFVPTMLLYPHELPKYAVLPVSFQKKSTTGYKISDMNVSSAQKILVFSERYDDWWELVGVKAQHVRANGYANAWILDENLRGDLLLIYKGEKYFFYGKLVSFIAVGGGIIYMCLRLFQLLKHHG